jgi:hypothetical protein
MNLPTGAFVRDQLLRDSVAVIPNDSVGRAQDFGVATVVVA